MVVRKPACETWGKHLFYFIFIEVQEQSYLRLKKKKGTQGRQVINLNHCPEEDRMGENL